MTLSSLCEVVAVWVEFRYDADIVYECYAGGYKHPASAQRLALIYQEV